MSDPEYVSTTHASGPPEPSQTDLDEQLARRLMLEEEQQAAQYQRRAQSAGWPNLRDNTSSQPYQSRTQGGRSPPQQQGERDTVTEFQESFNKIAESGKKTFSSIVSKVKAKMQEFDQNQNQRQGEPSNPGYSYANAQPAWSAGQPRTNTYAQPPPASYYDPNGPDSAPSRGHSYSENYGSGGGSLPPVQGYNMDPHPAPRDLDDDSLYVDDSPAMGRGTQRKETSAVSSTGANTAAIATSASPPSAASPVAPPRPSASPPPASAFTSGGVARPPATGTGTGRTSFDASKLGILPKRPVSLLRPGTQSPPPRHVTGDDDDDELEYTENPFEDGKK
ncbi:hypothetical protein BJ138DRAFT_1139392 [Hygrophoropsis aurantiaca]|uniref:Uncharacterized protein n=1 Tax=Hygrophoropsis aurantiaca TaxID=72124 RepID=A0ACB8ATA1_9AGAM|nr:hypothetical protein BJ138DRAFT_1139392 [Hygrophoropsis aurantiaca]